MGNAQVTSAFSEEQSDKTFQAAIVKKPASEDELSTASSVYDVSALLNTEKLLNALKLLSCNDINELKKLPHLEHFLNNQREKQATVTYGKLEEFVRQQKEFDTDKLNALQEFFSKFDVDGHGYLEIDFVSKMLKNVNGPTLGDLLVQSGPSLPDAVDIYSMDEQNKSFIDPLNIIMFLRRYRVSSVYLSSSPDFICTKLSARFQNHDKFLSGRFKAIKEEQLSKATSKTQKQKDNDINEDDFTTVTNCFTNVSCSRGSNDKIMNLLDEDLSTYWESTEVQSGSSNDEPTADNVNWIRFHMNVGVFVKELSIDVNGVDDGDQIPKTVGVSVGDSSTSMKQIVSKSIPRGHSGTVIMCGGLSAEYSYVQINILESHGSNATARIRQVHLSAYGLKNNDTERLQKERPTALDSLVMWYLGIVSSVSTSALSLAPALRNTLLNESRDSLQHLPPLCLSKTSSYKSEAFNPLIAKKIESVIKSLCLAEGASRNERLEALPIYMKFVLCVGNINSILECLQIMLQDISLNIPVGDLVKKLANLERKKRSFRAQPLTIEAVSCDSQAHEDTTLENVFNSSSRFFKTQDCVKVVNLMVKVEKSVEFHPTSIHMRFSDFSDCACRGVMVFGFEDVPTDIETNFGGFTKRFEEYDKWTNEKLKNRENVSKEDSEMGMLGYFTWNEEAKTIQEIISTVRPIKYLLFKILGDEDGTKKVSVKVLVLRGCKVNPQQTEIDNVLKQTDEMCLGKFGERLSFVQCSADRIVGRVLTFICRMLIDLNMLKKIIKDTDLSMNKFKESHICVDDFSLETFWTFYKYLNSRSSEGVLNQCSLVCLLLLRYGIPFVKPISLPTQPSDKPLGQMGVSLGEEGVSTDLLAHLCSLVESADSEPIVHTLVKDIIKEGVVVFFPGSHKTRKSCLLEMANTMTDSKKSRSWMLKFEALCDFFVKDTKSLLVLNWNIKNIDRIDPDDILSVLKTIIVLAKDEVMTRLRANVHVQETSKAAESESHLVKLLCALQSSLLFWCRHLLAEAKKKDNEDKQSMLTKGAFDTITQYATTVVECCHSILKTVQSVEDIESAFEILENSIIGQTLPQLFSLLGSLSSVENLPLIQLLHTLQPLTTIISAITLVSSGCQQQRSDQDKEPDDVIIGLWNRDHKYSNKSKPDLITEDFVVPTASKFVIDFKKESCRIGKKSPDRFKFTDSRGNQQSFYDECGGRTWPTSSEFKGNRLTYQFKVPKYQYTNDKYSFTLKAYGKPVPQIHWLYDLNVRLARVIGQIVSSLLTIDVSCAPVNKTSEMQALLKSDIWKTIFRGGTVVGKLMRSLSGAFETTSSKDASLCSMLYEMAEGEEPSPLIEMCRSAKPLPSFGGPLVDKVIRAIFAALIWHSQEIREELSSMMESSFKPSVNVIDAFTAAEAIRRELVESRQKVLEAKESEENKDAKAKMDEDESLHAYHDKAMFLLKFAGLTKVSYDSVKPGSPVLGRPPKLQKSLSVVSTVDRIKQQISREAKPLSPAEKHPSFETVLSFVRNTGLTVANVETLLQERAELARRMSEGYGFAAEYLRVMSSELTTPQVITLLTFLQHLFVHQNKFPRHYDLEIAGCGLGRETLLRKSVQLFLHRLIDIIRTHKSSSNSELDRDSIVLMGNVFSHFLDVSWQDNDLKLLKDLKLPDYLFESVIEMSPDGRTVAVDKFKGEDKMLKRCEMFVRFLRQWKKISSMHTFLSSDVAQKEDIKEVKLFVILIITNPSHYKSMSVACDGCKSDIVRDWYRNVDIEDDCDLCVTCFTNGTGERPSGFKKEHVLLHVGHHQCAGCGISIVTHRFVRQSDKSNYCLGCFRKEKSQCHWTVYLLTEHPATDTTNAFMSSSEEHSKPMEYRNGILTELKSVSEGAQYNRQHNWLLYSSLTLMMANRLNNKENTDPQYLRYACELLMTCLRLIAQGLGFTLSAAKDAAAFKQEEMDLKKKKEAEKEVENEQKLEGAEIGHSKEDAENVHTEVSGAQEPPNESQDSSPIQKLETETLAQPAPVKQKIQKSSSLQRQEATCKSDCSNLDEVSCSEKAFGLMYYESMIGLLASVLPKEPSLQPWISACDSVEKLVGDAILPQLLRIARSEEMSSTHRLQALNVAVKYMSRVSPEVADHAINMTEDVASEGSTDRKETKGQRTVDYLFEMGVTSLKGSDISNAACVGDCFMHLCKTSKWRPIVSQRIVDSISDTCTSSSNIDRSVVFGLLLLAGFPKLAKVGSSVSWYENQEKKHGVLTAPITDSQANVINRLTRESHMLKLLDMKIEDQFGGCVTENQLRRLISIIHQNLLQDIEKSNGQVEHKWILSLSLKALSVLLKESTSNVNAIIKCILSENTLPSIVELACKPTYFSKQWLLSDLEILGLLHYSNVSQLMKPDEEKNTHPVASHSRSRSSSQAESHSDAESFHSETSDDEYPSVEEETTNSSEEDTSSTKSKSTIIDVDKEPNTNTIDECEDTGTAAIVCCESVDPKDLMAIPENIVPNKTTTKKKKKGGTCMTDFFPSSDDMKQEKDQIRRERISCQLLLEQMNQLSIDKNKVYNALAILHAREVLAFLLLNWQQDSPKLNSELLGLENSHWFSLLNSLIQNKTQEEKNKILKRVVACSQPDELVTLGLTAAQCMKEVIVDMTTKEFEYQTEDKTYTGSVMMPNAANIRLSVDTGHSLHGTVSVAANDDFTEHHWSRSHTGDKKSEQQCNHPGNVVHYKIELDGIEEKSDEKKTWLMKISGLQNGRFETSYLLLNLLLGGLSTTPISGNDPPTARLMLKLWPCLIAAACELTGEQRIKVIGLLLHLIQWNSSALKNKDASDSGGAAGVMPTTKRLDLTMLKPLWTLYTSTSKEFDKRHDDNLSHEILRGLTELFLVVENAALEWKVGKDFLVETVTEDSLSLPLEKGISNVAYVSIALELDNTVSRAFIEAKKNYVPPTRSTSIPGNDGEHSTSSDSVSQSSISNSDSSRSSLRLRLRLEDSYSTSYDEDSDDYDSSDESS